MGEHIATEFQDNWVLGGFLFPTCRPGDPAVLASPAGVPAMCQGRQKAHGARFAAGMKLGAY